MRGVGTASSGVDPPAFLLGSGAAANLASQVEFSHGGLAGQSPLLGEQRDDEPLLGGSLVLLLGVELADQLLGTVRFVQSLHQSHHGAEISTTSRPPGPK